MQHTVFIVHLRRLSAFKIDQATPSVLRCQRSSSWNVDMITDLLLGSTH